jgi:mono/diheme cytochrome c family protein
LGLFIAMLLLIAACGGIDNPTETSKPTTAAPSSPGEKLFTAVGCAACHGLAGEGSAIAPGLAGHTGAQVPRQARAPLGMMPVFSPSQVSNEELRQIAEYIEGLSGDHLHMTMDDTGQASAQHHWMTLFALEDGSNEEAIHHIDHIIGLVAGQHKAQMEEAKAEIEAGNLHEGTHIIENMLAGVEVDDLTPSEMHASLARSSALIEDAAGALHHLDHIAPDLSDHLVEIREMLESGALSDAAHELEEVTGLAHEEEHEEEEEHGH